MQSYLKRSGSFTIVDNICYNDCTYDILYSVVVDYFCNGNMDIAKSESILSINRDMPASH